jgi:translation elongation factor EF-G
MRLLEGKLQQAKMLAAAGDEDETWAATLATMQAERQRGATINADLVSNGTKGQDADDVK